MCKVKAPCKWYRCTEILDDLDGIKKIEEYMKTFPFLTKLKKRQYLQNRHIIKKNRKLPHAASGLNRLEYMKWGEGKYAQCYVPQYRGIGISTGHRTRFSRMSMHRSVCAICPVMRHNLMQYKCGTMAHTSVLLKHTGMRHYATAMMRIWLKYVN